MSGREATAQQTDPLGALTQRPITIVIAGFGVVLGAVRTLTSADPSPRVGLGILSVALIALAAVLLVIASSPLRAPFSCRSFSIIVFIGILAMICEAGAHAGHDVMIRDDWGGPALGLLLLASAPFRPSLELVVGTAVSAVCVACVVAAEAPTFATKAPALLYVVVGITPVVALGAGAAVYSKSFVRQVEQWLARASELTSESAGELRPGIARSVQQDRVTGLNREVVPFFTDLLDRGVVTEADRDRARRVADTLRSRIVAESDRSWLEQVLLDVCPDGHAGTVDDRAQVASAMSPDQRTAVRALVNALGRDPAASTSTLGIVLHDDAPLARAVIRVNHSDHHGAVHKQYAPYFAVLRILFHDLRVDVNGSFLTLRFSYDQH